MRVILLLHSGRQRASQTWQPLPITELLPVACTIRNYAPDLANRRSFSPDAAYYVGPESRGKFLDGAPMFALEVRSEGDYGPAAELEMAAKRCDYFAAASAARDR